MSVGRSVCWHIAGRCVVVAPPPPLDELLGALSKQVCWGLGFFFDGVILFYFCFVFDRPLIPKLQIKWIYIRFVVSPILLNPHFSSSPYSSLSSPLPPIILLSCSCVCMVVGWRHFGPKGRGGESGAVQRFHRSSSKRKKTA